jgi:hypothetical protein
MNYKGIKDQSFSCKNCNTEFAWKGYSFTHTFCSRACNLEYKAKQSQSKNNTRYQLWLEGKSFGIKNPRKMIKQWVLKRDGHKCNQCGITEWREKPITLWCDHIDGDATNNHPDNFQLVCPNCDSQSETFGSKNKGRGRKSRGLPQYG